MNAAGQLAILIGISLSASAIHYKLVGPPDRSVRCDPAALKPHEICLDEVMSRWQGKVLWVDARLRTQWQADGIPGSILWNTDAAEDALKFEADAMEHLVDSPTVIVYCGEGNCGISLQIVERILKLGVVSEVHALHGGAGTLKAAGMLKGSSLRP
jgi:rhodanese-related sulfurtransferase